MVFVGVREFRAGLRHWLERAAAGEEIVITDRGRAMAKVAPIDPEDPAARRQRLIDEGVLIPAKKPKRPSSELPRIPTRGSVSDLFLQEKNERDY